MCACRVRFCFEQANQLGKVLKKPAAAAKKDKKGKKGLKREDSFFLTLCVCVCAWTSYVGISWKSGKDRYSSC